MVCAAPWTDNVGFRPSGNPALDRSFYVTAVSRLIKPKALQMLKSEGEAHTEWCQVGFEYGVGFEATDLERSYRVSIGYITTLSTVRITCQLRQGSNNVVAGSSGIKFYPYVFGT